ncbi:uncharacterized protein K489DRAFT_407878 [Dissoconium aciculare CBS 342.82]|uniref:Uncharacterized protein n=1 Tax=Dissoconium aciculare CBS 342.82 TaxID=1314786 RepID=A0A6J3MBE9_9PEZI|nr:uncharacterized protein K489DRAFT_407878 [Dissoconium aciculare CBS 342.82]KAF1825188.1 hypothetical protein K489DRAFT_407878 [Dissoconium aciculare CBS 342.82]
MSGNPFRRPQTDKEHDGVDSDHSTQSARTAAKKRVKIQTPPRSPETTLAPSQNSTRRPIAGTPVRAKPGFADGSDSSAAEDDGPEEADLSIRYGTRAAQGISATSLASGKGAPYNPFARTLATSEAETNLQIQPSPGRDENIRSEQGVDARTERPILDVDAFTSILLTGKAVPTAPVDRTSPSATASIAPTSGGLDGRIDPMAAFTRHSIFHQSHNIHPESPRSSFDYDRSESEDDGFEGDGNKLMGRTDFRSQDIAPQAPPKPKVRGPQTVSFADFDQSIPPGFQSTSGRRSPPVNTHLHGILRPTYARSPSDLNKPLPLPPQDPFTSPAPPAPAPEKPIQPSEAVPSPPLPATPAPESVVEQTGVKKKPPPPPATRRLAASSERPRDKPDSRSDTGLTADRPPAATDRKASDATTKASSQPPPPPPPSRKAHSPATVPTVEADVQVTAEPPVSTAPETNTTSDPKTTPRPPPRRQPSRTGSSVSQTPPESSVPVPKDEAVAEPSKPPPPAPSSSAAPPPPPRRRGGASSKRNSGEHSRRLSTHSFDSDRNASVSSLPSSRNLEAVADDDEAVIETPVAATAAAAAAASSSPTAPAQSTQQQQKPDQSTILADMSAFQAEIDALMAKADRGPTDNNSGNG